MERLRVLVDDLDRLPEKGWCAGAVTLIGRGPYVALEHATGWALRYASWDPVALVGRELPTEQWVPMRENTVFDLASVTKLFTAIAVLQQVERGTVDLDTPVAHYAPELVAAKRHRFTLRGLLTHTTGLRPELPLYELPVARRWERVWAEEPEGRGGDYRYSDLNFLLTQTVLERVGGAPLDVLLEEGVTRPLGMRDTRFRPPRSWHRRAAATEDQRRPWAKADRGLLRGEVHDENAAALGGVAGHAGMFSTARDMAVLCRTLLTGGAYGPARILTPSSVAQLLAPPGLGFVVNEPRFMGELAGPLSEGRAAGHTGFTGTSVVLDPVTDTFVVLLANRVHPVRRPADSGPRAMVATHVARAVRS